MPENLKNKSILDFLILVPGTNGDALLTISHHNTRGYILKQLESWMILRKK